MRVEPELNEVVNGKRGMTRGIQVALDAQCLISAIALMFSTIDALAALSRPIDADDTTREHFAAWCDRYLQSTQVLGCESVDLYAARCGVLHTYGHESRLGRQGRARSLVYEWRQGPRADASVPLPEDAIVIAVEALHSALGDAIKEFLRDSETDPDVRARVQHHLPSLLCYKPWRRLESVVAA